MSTEVFEHFLRLAGETFDPSTPLAIIAVVAVLGLAGAAYHRRSLRMADAVRAGLLCLLPVTILAWGTVREHTTSHGDRSVQNWLESDFYVLHGLVAVSVVLLGVAVWRSPGRRAFMIAVSTLVLWWVFMAWFVSGMSISGDWL
jgi:hypothetical protein